MVASVKKLPTPPQTAVQSVFADDLIRTYLPLVGHLVRELHGRLPAHVNRDDLTSAGMMALVTSAQGFDASRGVPFNRFATIRIRGALTDELRSMDWASRGVRSRAREVDLTKQQLTAALGRTPTRTEIAQTMGVSVTDLDAVAADVHRAATLSVEGLAEAAGGDLVPSRAEGPESLLMRREQIGLLHDAIAELPGRLRLVVEQYFYDGRRMADIAADLGVTESRVSQLRSEALTMLKDGLKGQELTQEQSADSDSVRNSARGSLQASTDVLPPAISAQQRNRRASNSLPDTFETADLFDVGHIAHVGDVPDVAGMPDVAGTRVAAVRPIKSSTIKASSKPSRRDLARQAYIAAIASRSTLATRLAATTSLGETHAETAEGLRAAQ